MVLLSAVKKYVISCDNEMGKARRSALNYDFVWVKGGNTSQLPSDLKEKFTGRNKGDNRASVIACFHGHYKAWQMISDAGDDNSIILEDDGLCIRPYENDVSMPQGCITLLGGTIRGAMPWANEKAKFFQTGAFLQVLAKMSPGINKLQGCRFTMAISYFLPRGVAKELLDRVLASSHIRVVDIWLFNTGLVTSLLWPNMYGDIGISTQCGTKLDQLGADFYVCSLGRKEALKHGVQIPQRGADVTEFYEALKNFAPSVNTDTRFYLMCFWLVLLIVCFI